MEVFAFICMILAVGSVDGIIRSFQAKNNRVKKGAEIILRCEFDKLTTKEFQHINKELNTTLHFNGDDIETEWGSRFDLSVDENSEAQTFTQTLTIKNATSGDSGNYSCTIFNKGTQRMEHQFLIVSVEDEPKTVRLYLDDEEVFNGSYSGKLKPLKAYRLQCETTGSNPGANITLMSGSVKLDITNVTYSKPIYQYGNLVPVTVNTTAVVNHWVFDSHSFEVPVICSARVSADVQPISAFFTPQFEEAAPQFDCNDIVYAIDGQKDFAITCQLFSKPTLSNATFFFTSGKIPNTIPGTPFNILHTYGNYRGIVQNVDGFRFNMTLTVGTVDVKAGIKFNFWAQNSKGSALHVVTINQRSVSSASLLTLSPLLPAMMFISAIAILLQ